MDRDLRGVRAGHRGNRAELRAMALIGTESTAQPPLSEPVDWRQHAACRDMYTTLGKEDPFFPSRGKADVVNDKALKICFACPVKQECLDYALEKREINTGIFGGKTPSERKWLYEKAQKAKGIQKQRRKRRKAKAS